MASFITKQVSVETLGEYLRDARLHLGLSQIQVSELTQIPPVSLSKLESGEYATLPADVYVKGFLKSLAAVYRVEPEILLEQYDEEKKIDQSLKNKKTKTQKSTFPRMVITPKTLTLSLAGTLAVLVVGYLVWQVTSVTAAPRLEILSPEGSLTTQSRSILLRGQTEAGARVYVNSQEVPVEDSGIFSEVINLSEGVNNILVRAQNKFENVMEINRVVVVTPAEVALAGSAVSTGFTQPIEVALEIGPEDTWVEIVADEEVAYSGILPAGTTELFTAAHELILSTGNSGSTRLIYNGQDLGVLGHSGETLKNIRFTP